MNTHLFAVIFTLVVSTGWSKHCPNDSSISKRSNSNKLICYYSKLSDVDSCFCSHIILPANSDIKSVEDVKRQIRGVKIFVTVNEFNEGIIELLKSNKVDGLEIRLKKLSTKHDITDFMSTISKKIGSELDIFLSVPAKAELLAKYFDFKALSKDVDSFILETAFLGVSKNVTFHPSRLSGLWDMQNTDSVVDLVTGMGVPVSKLVITAPVQGFSFTLQNKEFTAPGSPAVELKSITRDELCDIIDQGGKNWTLERDEDQSGPYIFNNNQWIAFEDTKSIDIKAKYSRVRGLAGMALKDVSLDGSAKCNESILEAAFNGLSRQARAPRGAVLHSLEREILETPNGQSQSVHLSPFRISRIIDTEGHIHVVRQDTRTEFQCSRQGYFVHPRSCNRFYRCVKFDQLVDDFNVFEFDCPAGLAFDERVEVCVWPGSLPHGTPCAGSSEIAPVPRQRFDCPSEPGYYADPENCRWFFACLDHGQSRLVAYEFRCPFGLVFDGDKLLCEWPWLVPKCADGLGGEFRTTYVYGGGPFGSGSFHSADILDHYNGLGALGAVRLGGIVGQIEKPVARIYSNVGLDGNRAVLNGYQNYNGYIEGTGLSNQAAQSLQNAGLIKINNGVGIVQPYQHNLVGIVDSPNIQYSGGVKFQNQNLHTLELEAARIAVDNNVQNAGITGYGFVKAGDADFNSENNAFGNLNTIGSNQVNAGAGNYVGGNEHGNGAISSQSLTQQFGAKELKPIQYVTSQTLAHIPVSLPTQTTFSKYPFTAINNVKLEHTSIDGKNVGQYQYGFAQTVKPVTQQINIENYETGTTKSVGNHNLFQGDSNYYTQNKENLGYAVDFEFTEPISLKSSNQYQGGVFQSATSTPVDQDESVTATAFGSTRGAISTSSFTQYHGENNQNALVDKYTDASQNQNLGQGVAGTINIIGGGFSAVGVPRVEINDNVENLQPVSLTGISTTIPTITKVPVPGIKTVVPFQSFKGGVIANVPEFQYRVHSNGDFGLRNISTQFVNFVSTSPTPLSINDGLQYSQTISSIPTQSVTESSGYVYEKPKIAFEDTPLKVVQQEHEGYVYEKPKISFEETPTKSVSDVTITGYSDVTSTVRPLVTIQPHTVHVSSTILPTTVVQENLHLGYVYKKPSVAFNEGHIDTPTVRPIIRQHIVQPTIQPVVQRTVQPVQSTVSTFLVNNFNTSVDHVLDGYRPHVLVQPQAIQPQIQIQPQVRIQQQVRYQPLQIGIKKIERPQEPVIISKFSIRKPVEQQTYYYQKPQLSLQRQPLEVAQPVVYQQQIQLQQTKLVSEQPTIEVGYQYPKPKIRFEEQPNIFQYQQPFVKSTFTKVSTPVPTRSSVYYQQPLVEVRQHVSQPTLPQVVKVIEEPQPQPFSQTVRPISFHKIEKQPKVVEFYQRPVVEAPRPFIQKTEQPIEQELSVHQLPQTIYYNQRPNVQTAVEQRIIEQPQQRIVPLVQEQRVIVESPQQQVHIVKEQPHIVVPQQTIHYQQQPVIQKEVAQIQQQPQGAILSTSRPVIHTYQEQPNLAILQNHVTPYTYHNTVEHAAVVKTQTPKPHVVEANVQTSTFRPVVANTYNYVDFGEATTPKYEIYKTNSFTTPVSVGSSTGYSYPKPAVKFEEVHRPVVEVPFVRKTAYVTGQDVQPDYRFEKPSVTVVEGYNYPKPAIKFEEERIPVEKAPFVKKTTYVTGQQVQPGYRYEKPSIPFEAVPIVNEDYKISNYETVKQKVFGSRLYVPTPNPAIEIKYPTTPQIYTKVIPSTTTNYVETTSRPLIQYNQVYAQQENTIGYAYPKPAINFEEGAKVIENYQYPIYDQVKQTPLEPSFTDSYIPSTPKPTFYTTVAAVGQKLHPISTIPVTDRPRTYYTTTTENYPSNYEILRERVRYDNVPSTTPYAPETSVYNSVTVPSVVRTTSKPILKYSFSSLDENNNYPAGQDNKLFYGLKEIKSPVKIQQSQVGYVYPKSSVTFEEGAKVIENYEFPQYQRDKQTGYSYTTATSPRPTLETIVTTAPKQKLRTYYSITSGTTTTDVPVIMYNRYVPGISTTPQSSTVNIISSTVPNSKIVEEYNAPEVTTLSRDYLPIKSIIRPTSKVDITTFRPRGRIGTTIKLVEPEIVTQPSREYLPVRSRIRVTTTTPTSVEEDIPKDYEIQKLSPVRTIVKQNGYHPMLSTKLGAQCLCVSDSLRLTNKKGRKLKILVVDEDDNPINDDEDGDGYIVESEKGKVVESYEYKPDGELEITPRPMVVLKGTTEAVSYAPRNTISIRNNRIKVTPVGTTTEVYSTPATYAQNLFVRRKDTIASSRSRSKSQEGDNTNSVSDYEIVTAVRTGLKLVKQAAKDGARAGTEAALQKSFDRYGPGGVRSRNERLQGTVDCKRAGLFRHPTECNKFYACRWDCNKNRFTLHVFNCPVHLTFDNTLGACNWPSQGPACVDNTLITSD